MEVDSKIPDPSDPDAWLGRTRKGRLAPDQGLWEALGQEKGLRAVLTDFYTRVYGDERLAPFFIDVGMDWAIDKQFNFLRSIFTGARNYMGNMPRHAHHWMVISGDLFDYREDLLQACLLEHGLSEELAGRIRGLNETFRRAIVKEEPIPLHPGDPVDGWDRMVMPVGTVCDGCQGPIDEGDIAVYHVRTGKTYCRVCRPTAES